MNSPVRLFIDSCVWIDSYLGTHPCHAESLAFIARAHEMDAMLLYGASKLESIFYILIAEAKRLVRAEKGAVSEADSAAARAFAWGCIENIRECATAVGVDEADLWLAGKYRSFNPDFEDNVVLAGVERSQADWLVTWDEALLRTPLVRTATPTELRTLLDMSKG